MYRRHARLTRLEAITTPPRREPDPRFHGTPPVATFLKARSIEQMEEMEAAWLHVEAGGSVSDLDPGTVTLMHEWEAVSRSGEK